VLGGSLPSAVLGFLVLRFAPSYRPEGLGHSSRRAGGKRPVRATQGDKGDTLSPCKATLIQLKLHGNVTKAKFHTSDPGRRHS
jgi:hypothetical protein